LLALAVVAAGMLVVRGDLWRGELNSLSPVSKAALALDASLRAELSAGDASSLVIVQAADAETALRAAETVLARLEPLVASGRLGGVDSATRFLPSLATQQARLDALPGEASLRAALAEATAGGPLKAERLAPFVAEVARARTLPPITPASLHGTALAPLVEALLLHRPDGSWAALMPLQPAGDKLDGAAVRQALQGVPGAQALDIGAELSRLYARYLREAQTQALLGAGGVVLLVALALRSLPRVLAVCQPLVLAVLLTMAGLALLGVDLGILHLVGLLLVVAVGSNYALFFDMLRQRPAAPADADTLASLLLANATTVLSFGLIAMSSIPALSAIGRVVAPGALLALVLSATLLPRGGRGAA
jgi:predicted exporter